MSSVVKFALMLLACFSLQATLVPRLTIEDLSRQSQRIVRGTVLSSRVAWGPEHRSLWTHYEIQIGESFKGPKQKTMTVSEPGGTLGSTTMAIPGSPRMASGQQVVLFLYQTPVRYWRTLGWAQGCYTISGGKVRRNLAGLEFRQGSPSDDSELSVADLIRRVRHAIDRKGVR